MRILLFPVFWRPLSSLLLFPLLFFFWKRAGGGGLVGFLVAGALRADTLCLRHS